MRTRKTYKPNNRWRVVFNAAIPGWLDGSCNLAGERTQFAEVCRGRERGYVYVTSSGWFHVRCYHRKYGFNERREAAAS